MGGKAPKIVVPKPAPLPVYEPPPAPPPPVVMPVADDASITAAKKKRAALEMQRSGRASTILTSGDSETLG